MQTPTGLSAQELSARIITGLAASPPDEDALRALVHALVRTWRTLGWPVERMVIEIKHLVAAAQRFHPQSVTWVEVRELGDRAITWCIERYYRDS